jgi:predicted transcriptional regulator
MRKTMPFSMRLRPELKQRLQELANLDRRSLTNYVELLLEDHVTHAGQGSARGKKGSADEAKATRN